MMTVENRRERSSIGLKLIYCHCSVVRPNSDHYACRTDVFYLLVQLVLSMVILSKVSYV